MTCDVTLPSSPPSPSPPPSLPLTTYVYVLLEWATTYVYVLLEWRYFLCLHFTKLEYQPYLVWQATSCQLLKAMLPASMEPASV